MIAIVPCIRDMKPDARKLAKSAQPPQSGIPLFRTKAKPLDGCTHRNRANSTTLFARAAQFLGHGTL